MNSENLSEEIQESGRLLLADGPWDPLGDEPRPLEYTMRKKGERTYVKNAAVDTTFQVKVNDRYRGQRLRDIRRGLHGMFTVCSKTSSKRRAAIWRATIWDVW